MTFQLSILPWHTDKSSEPVGEVRKTHRLVVLGDFLTPHNRELPLGCQREVNR